MAAVSRPAPRRGLLEGNLASCPAGPGGHRLACARCARRGMAAREAADRGGSDRGRPHSPERRHRGALARRTPVRRRPPHRPRRRRVRVPSLDAVLDHLGGACQAGARRTYGRARIVPAPAHAAPARGGDGRAGGGPRMDVLQPARSHGRSRHRHRAGPAERRGPLRGGVGGGLSSTPARAAGCLGIPGDRGPRAPPGRSRIGVDAGYLRLAGGRSGDRDGTPRLRCTGDDDDPRRNRRRVLPRRPGRRRRRAAPPAYLGRRVHAGVGPTANPRRSGRSGVRLSSAAGLRRGLARRHGGGGRGSCPRPGNRARRRPGGRPAVR